MIENAQPTASMRPQKSRLTMRERLENAMIKAVRLYTFNTPIDKGKYRLMQAAISACRYVPKTVTATTRDGRSIALPISAGMGEAVYFLGEYEREVTRIVEELVRPGDVCLDVGANFGWFTTLLAKLSGPEGFVHAFEPVPSTFAQLESNVALTATPSRIKINNAALGDREDEVIVHVFDDIGLGFSSLSEKGSAGATAVRSRMLTLDAYLGGEREERRNINFVKLDIEGAELMFLKGASMLFDQQTPPIILAEMATEQSRNFGYSPNELIEFIGSRRPYEFYAVNEFNGEMERIEGFRDDEIGANVFCLPAGHYADRRDRIAGRFIS